ncbi:MAG: hypothetical protein H0X51_09945 [Parachlamydiaceae bacterium]|nr:hypothetical protein [Parachlamydiaceae bacterium]
MGNSVESVKTQMQDTFNRIDQVAKAKGKVPEKDMTALVQSLNESSKALKTVQGTNVHFTPAEVQKVTTLQTVINAFPGNANQVVALQNAMTAFQRLLTQFVTPEEKSADKKRVGGINESGLNSKS